MIIEKDKFLTVSWLSGLLSAEMFISTGERGGGVHMPPLTTENSHFLWSGPQEATLVVIHEYDTSDLYINYSYYVSEDEFHSVGDNDDSKSYPRRLLTNLEINGKTFQVQFDTGGNC